jgi:hypothetical protein
VILAGESLGQLGAQSGHRSRQLGRPSGRFAEPEGNRRRLAVGVGDTNAAVFDSYDFPRGVAKLKDVALQALYRPIFVHGSDYRIGWFENHGVIGSVGDRAA